MMDEEIFPKTKPNLTVIGIFLAGLFVLALGAGLFWFKGNFGKKASEGDIQILSASTSNLPASEIMVDVSGAVVSPGVYRVSGQSRVDDVVKAAGGLTGDADRSRVNLAAKVSDGQKISIPTQNSNVKTQNGGGEAGASLLISINSATVAELDKLPGVGPVTAQKIIASRPYSSLEDLLSKKAVTKSVYEKIRDLISL